MGAKTTKAAKVPGGGLLRCAAAGFRKRLPGAVAWRPTGESNGNRLCLDGEECGGERDPGVHRYT